MELIIESFDGVDKRLLSMRFDDARSFRAIGVRISMSESSVKRNIDKLIMAIARDLEIKDGRAV